MKKSGAAQSLSAPGPRPLPKAKVPSDHPGMPTPGDTIAGKYQVVRWLGEGGMAVVYEAVHLRLRQRLAIKVLRAGIPDFEEVLTRFER